jgi:hypothetical protein
MSNTSSILIDSLRMYAALNNDLGLCNAAIECINTQAARIKELEKASLWQPIETAPRDSSKILLGLPVNTDDDSGSVSTAGYWQEGWEDSVDDMGCDNGFVDVHYQEFSPSRSFGAAAYRSTGRQPTHWMPLPKPPTIEDKQ